MEIYPGFSNKKYVLRDFPQQIGKDLSLNRCTDIETSRFLPGKINLGKPTPNAENDCTGSNFIVEDHIIDVTSSVLRVNAPETAAEIDESAPEQSCASRFDRREYFSLQKDSSNKK